MKIKESQQEKTMQQIEQHWMKIGEAYGCYVMANEMRVLFCALITAHQRDDFIAFWATVEIVKHNLKKHIEITDDEWHVFRGVKHE